MQCITRQGKLLIQQTAWLTTRARGVVKLHGMMAWHYIYCDHRAVIAVIGNSNARGAVRSGREALESVSSFDLMTYDAGSGTGHARPFANLRLLNSMSQGRAQTTLLYAMCGEALRAGDVLL